MELDTPPLGQAGVARCCRQGSPPLTPDPPARIRAGGGLALPVWRLRCLEDAKLLDLPRDRDGIVLSGYLLDLSDRMLDRTYSACTSRLQKLRQRAAVRLRATALVCQKNDGRPVNVEAFTGA